MCEEHFFETQSVREVIENRGGEDPDVDYPGVVDYFPWAEDHDCCGEAINHAVDISVQVIVPIIIIPVRVFYGTIAFVTISTVVVLGMRPIVGR